MSARSTVGRTPRGRLRIGRVGAPHGLSGRVKVRLSFQQSRSLEQVDRVWLVFPDGSGREFGVREVGGSSTRLLLWLEGVDDRDAAARLTGAEIEIAREALEPLAPGEFYLVDLIGAPVVGPDGPLGEVIDVVVNPSVDSVRIRLLDGRIAEQPLSAPWVSEVDPDGAGVVLASVDGLIV